MILICFIKKQRPAESTADDLEGLEELEAGWLAGVDVALGAGVEDAGAAEGLAVEVASPPDCPIA
jgi:hypothetical protein